MKTTTTKTMLRTMPTATWRRACIQIAAAALVMTACGGDDSSDEADAGAVDVAESTADETTDADDQSRDEPTQVDEPGDTTEQNDATEPEGEPEPADQADDGGSVSGADVDWATVDLTTIDWANIDLDDIDFAATDDNPTTADLSEADLAIIQERMAARFGSGAATLTVGDRTFDFEGFQCAFESSGVLNDGTTLGTNLFGEVDGAQIQMQIDVYDDGTAQFTMDDIDDFENPSVSFIETTDIAVTVDGDTVRAEGDVTDQASDTFDVVPMTFEGECGPGSIR
jgi:hypothetical protein